MCEGIRLESACQFIHLYVLSNLVAAPAAGSAQIAQKRSIPELKPKLIKKFISRLVS